MPSTYTSQLRITKPATGDLTGTWGDTVNNEITTMIEQAIAGRVVVVMPADADYTLTALNGTSDEARCAVVRVTSGVSLSATRNVVCPTVAKLYIVENATTGGRSIVFKTTAGSGITIPSGADALVRCDGTNVVAWTSTPTPIASGGTGATTASTARTALGSTATGDALFIAATAAAARTALGSTTTGDAVFIAASAAAARTALGSTATGDALFVAATASTARTALGSTATGDAVFIAASAAAARSAMSAAASGANADITSVSGLTTPLSIAQGGTSLAAAPPIVQVYQTASGGNVPNVTYTQVPFDTEVVDSNSNFASSTFTPTVAGYYQVNCSYALAPASSYFLAIYKNGAIYKRGHWVNTAGGTTVATVAGLVSMNGSTDNIQIFAFQDSGALINVVGGSTISWFDAHFVRGL